MFHHNTLRIIFSGLYNFIVLDINECRNNSITHKCDKNAKCRNNKGSYTCICKTGYSGDGFKCQGTLICILIVVCQGHLTAIMRLPLSVNPSACDSLGSTTKLRAHELKTLIYLLRIHWLKKSSNQKKKKNEIISPFVAKVLDHISWLGGLTLRVKDLIILWTINIPDDKYSRPSPVYRRWPQLHR